MTSTSPQAPAPAPPPAPAPNPTSTPITDDQHVEIWKHLMEDVLRYKVGEDLPNLLKSNGVTDVIELMTEFASNEEDLVKWKYKRTGGTNSGSTYNISKKNIADILALQDYIYNVAARLLLATPAQMTYDQFMSLNRQDLAIMRTDPTYKKTRAVTFNTPAPPPANNANANNSVNGLFNNFTPAESFKKSIKRDPTHFPTLKTDDGYDSWKRGIQVNARVQDVEDVLNHQYIPNTDEDKELFALKQSYMYSIFEKNLLTNKGKAVVRKHQASGDAQTVFHEIDNHYTKSIKAQANSTEINHYIITTRIDDNKWNGTTYDYVIHWQEMVRLYHSLVPSTSYYNDKMLLDLLHNAVNPHPELRTVYQIAQQNALVASQSISTDWTPGTSKEGGSIPIQHAGCYD